jgi:hypothetical protein
MLTQLRDQLNELVLISENTSSGVEQHVASGFPDDDEGGTRVTALAELQIDLLWVMSNRRGIDQLSSWTILFLMSLLPTLEADLIAPK